MRFLRTLLDQQEKQFEKGGKLEKLYPLYEAGDTFLYTPGQVTTGPAHVRDAVDLKRLMGTVVAALVPCILMAMWNTGRQAHLAIQAGALPLDNWQTRAMELLRLGEFDPTSLIANTVHGALYYLPILIVTFVVGGNIEAIFAVVRKHEINEGFLVTGMLFPLTLPATIPLWQVAIGIAFGVVIGKEIFGGTGMNFLNPALTARVFLFFAYPAEISGDKVWIAAQTTPDTYSGATWLGQAALDGYAALETGTVSWMQAFLGDIPGSLGETSMVAVLIGTAILIVTGVGSWQIMAGVGIGAFGCAQLLNLLAPYVSNPMFEIPFHWHMVLGSLGFAAVFMATDPVSASQTARGRWIYGILIGVLGIVIRTINPAYPEGWMLAILFMNIFAPTIDHYVVQANVRRRRLRYAT
ncbi:MAG: NADH:ubiquinone reductase (Na(+)-transporting) subunit B [Acidobacteria bacterium]|nr:MAG: NADH:ubiquinone reductase (Na(+)-transporting) subunit B [Acidobacteriota bacterium]REK00281.1 MAG: NADH:ubiquinone reductase (Na(+)-transporting) subunit B [Acidobacteriota bacterium]